VRVEAEAAPLKNTTLLPTENVVVGAVVIVMTVLAVLTTPITPAPVTLNAVKAEAPPERVTLPITSAAGTTPIGNNNVKDVDVESAQVKPKVCEDVLPLVRATAE